MIQPRIDRVNVIVERIGRETQMIPFPSYRFRRAFIFFPKTFIPDRDRSWRRPIFYLLLSTFVLMLIRLWRASMIWYQVVAYATGTCCTHRSMNGTCFFLRQRPGKKVPGRMLNLKLSVGLCEKFGLFARDPLTLGTANFWPASFLGGFRVFERSLRAFF